jgi:hypothetical protein
LKQKNEEVQIKHQLHKVMQEKEDEERIERMDKQMNETQSKFLFTLDVKKAEKQRIKD